MKELTILNKLKIKQKIKHAFTNFSKNFHQKNKSKPDDLEGERSIEFLGASFSVGLEKMRPLLTLALIKLDIFLKCIKLRRVL